MLPILDRALLTIGRSLAMVWLVSLSSEIPSVLLSSLPLTHGSMLWVSNGLLLLLFWSLRESSLWLGYSSDMARLSGHELLTGTSAILFFNIRRCNATNEKQGYYLGSRLILGRSFCHRRGSVTACDLVTAVTASRAMTALHFSILRKKETFNRNSLI